MIAAPAVAPPADFEAILEGAVSNLKNTLRTAHSMSDSDFEEAVLRAMQEKAQKTVFDGHIVQTGKLEFPDITAAGFYGVEVKKTSKDLFKTAGNSIIEKTRVPGVEAIYLVIANKKTVRWKSYQDSIDNIVVTHSPRYRIDLDCTETVFDQMKISYDDFRRLPQPDKMKQVRMLYPDSKLWWLFTMEEGRSYRFWSSLSSAEQNDLRIKSMILCPEIFGDSHTKFQGVSVYAMGQGVIIPNVRDLFTAGGRVSIGGTMYPKIYGQLKNLLPDIDLTIPLMDTETLASFWGISPASNINHRQQQWRTLVSDANSHDLKNIFGQNI